MMAIVCGGCDQELAVGCTQAADVLALQLFTETHRHCAGLAEMRGRRPMEFRYLAGQSLPLEGERVGDR